MSAPEDKTGCPTTARARRIVNIYNFIRAYEPRYPAVSRDVLLETTARQIRGVREHGLPATFALQYDALIDSRYQELLRRELPGNCEIGAWWEIVQPQVEKAGLGWRGRYPWDWHAHVGFSPGYTPNEREKLVDVYMRDFKAIFGFFPATAGSWFIDAHTLRYMSEKYGIVASCNCKDQIGTDGYTLWGGYWNQGYYPSKRNAYIPAQEADAQIPVPIFRMLGSDPIYQYESGLGTARQGLISLEPVSRAGGANPEWVSWFLQGMTEEPCLAFAYIQAGQENAFTWEKMDPAYTRQLACIAQLAAEGRITVETLKQTGTWFRARFPLTPSTAVTATQDWKHEERKTVWYNSRFYRMNLLWEPAGFRVRDIQMFDQDRPEPNLDSPLTSTACQYDALPVVDGFYWSKPGELAGIRLVRRDGATRQIVEVGPPKIRETGTASLSICCPLKPAGKLEIQCTEGQAAFHLIGIPDPAAYTFVLTWSRNSRVPFDRIEPTALVCTHQGFPYRVTCSQGHFERLSPSGLDEDSAFGEAGILIVPEDQVVRINFTQRNRFPVP